MLRSNLDLIHPRRTSGGGSQHFRLDPLRSPSGRRRCLRFRSPRSRRHAPHRRPPRHLRPGRRCHSRSRRTSRPAPPAPKTITSGPVPRPRPPWTRSLAARARLDTTPPHASCHALAPTRSPLARCASLRDEALLIRRVAATKEHQGAAESVSVLRCYLAHPSTRYFNELDVPAGDLPAGGEMLRKGETGSEKERRGRV